MILFRAEGNASTGLGHIYRVLSLIDMIQETTWNYSLIVHKKSCVEIIPKHINIDSIDDDTDEFSLFLKYKKAGFKLLILDGYQFNSVYQKKAKDLGFKILYIDDLCEEFMYADAVINHCAGLKQSNFQKSQYTRLFLGPPYAILRKSFLDFNHSLNKNKATNQIFINFGGADPMNISAKVLPWIVELDVFNKIIVVTGKAYQKQLEDSKNDKVLFYQNIEAQQMANLIATSSLAIVPASTVLYEVCAINKPVISGYYVENQEKIYKGFLNERLIDGIGDFRKLEKKLFLNNINHLLLNKASRDELLMNQKKWFDGMSGSRIIKIVQSLL